MLELPTVRLARSGPGAPTVPAPSTPSGRLIRKLLWKRMYLPRRAVHAGLSAVKKAVALRRVRRRRSLCPDHPPRGFEIPQQTGLLRFDAGQLPGSAEAIAICLERFEALKNQTRGANPKKSRFLRTVITGDDFAREPELVRFMISEPIVAAAAHYLGAAPVLAGAALWWSPPNESASASQLWHQDHEDDRQLKIFFNVTDVSEDQGPLVCLPADRSAAPARLLRTSHRRLEDAEVAPLAGGAPLRLTGPAGSGAFVDTARCLHYGSRGNRRGRLLLMFQFLRLEAPTESKYRVARFPAFGDGLSELQRLAISDA